MRHLLLWVPCVVALWAPLYNMTEPTLFGIPFFYWWQMVWIVLTALCIVPVYRHQEKRNK